MIRTLCKILFVLPFWSVLYLAAQPTFAQASNAGPTSASTSNDWTPANWIALIVALGSTIPAIIGALRGTQAKAKADANEQTLTNFSARLDAHGQQITDLAKNITRPG